MCLCSTITMNPCCVITVSETFNLTPANINQNKDSSYEVLRAKLHVVDFFSSLSSFFSSALLMVARGGVGGT